MIRKAQVAGQFYPQTPQALKRQLAALVKADAAKEDALGVVAPHAGYMFSGSIAGACFGRVKLTETVVILGPNHTGLGAAFSIMTKGTWQMPLGNVDIDTALAKDILRESKYLEEDIKAHTYEHSIEVLLPFLQFLSPQVKIVPIVVQSADYAVYDDIGKAIAQAIGGAQKSLIVASSDMSHYLPQEKAEANDKIAIEAILNLNGQDLLARIKKYNITMCGYGPVVCMLQAAKELGATQARLVEYRTSGDACGDYTSVVGYASIIVQ